MPSYRIPTRLNAGLSRVFAALRRVGRPGHAVQGSILRRAEGGELAKRGALGRLLRLVRSAHLDDIDAYLADPGISLGGAGGGA